MKWSNVECGSVSLRKQLSKGNCCWHQQTIFFKVLIKVLWHKRNLQGRRLSSSFRTEISLCHLWISCWRTSVVHKRSSCVGNCIFSNVLWMLIELMSCFFSEVICRFLPFLLRFACVKFQTKLASFCWIIAVCILGSTFLSGHSAVLLCSLIQVAF